MFFSTVAIASVAALAVASPVKRGFGGRATFYATGFGACGDWNNDSDYIVALNSAQYGSGYPGPQCGKQIQISANGKTATATIKDECPTCNYGDLDLSPSLFNVFATPDDGVFQMTWDWVGSEEPRAVEAVAAPSSSEEAKPTASSTSEWSAPSSTVASSTKEWSAPSSSAVVPTSSVKATSASSSANASSSAPASSTVASVAAPTVTAVLNGADLAALAEAVAQAGQVVIVGTNANATVNGTTASSNGTTVANATVSFQ